MLTTVYLYMFCAILCFTIGSSTHLMWGTGGLFTLFSGALSLLCVCSTPAWRMLQRFFIEAYIFGAAFIFLANYLLHVDQVMLFHLIWEAGWALTVVYPLVTLLWLYFIQPWRVTRRFLLLMFATYCFGGSFGLFTSTLSEINQVIVVVLLAVSTAGIGTVWCTAQFTSDRKKIYKACVGYCCAIICSIFICIAFGIHNTAGWVLKVLVALVLFMGYLVLYSQELLYNARFGRINCVNCTLTVFFNLPAVVVHAARLYLGAAIRDWDLVFRQCGVELALMDARRCHKHKQPVLC